ncbi:MAG TPA: hypothetical protein VFU35_06655, partial [Jatrophihabitans sp.]|nr:hypothetical protein [Jatrophihabitans sp.]
MTATLEEQEQSAAPPAPPIVASGAEPNPPARAMPATLAPWEDPHPRLAWLSTLVIAAFAIITRFWALGFPNSHVFDEVYYATEAQEILRYGYEDNRD